MLDTERIELMKMKELLMNNTQNKIEHDSNFGETKSQTSTQRNFGQNMKSNLETSNQQILDKDNLYSENEDSVLPDQNQFLSNSMLSKLPGQSQDLIHTSFGERNEVFGSGSKLIEDDEYRNIKKSPKDEKLRNILGTGNDHDTNDNDKEIIGQEDVRKRLKILNDELGNEFVKISNS